MSKKDKQKENKKKTKRNYNPKSKVNKKNVNFVLFYLKTLKTLKILFGLFILCSIVYMFFLLNKKEFTSKIKTNFSNSYSDIFNKNICNNIEINGVKETNIEELEKKIDNFCNLKNKNNINHLLNEIKNDPWIKNITIKKRLPNIMSINIEEYIPFVIWKTENDMHLIDESGNIIPINDSEKINFIDLMVVSGKNSKDGVYSLFNMLSSNPALFSRIREAFFIGERRWNLEFDNGIIIKMPEKDIIKAWHNLDKILSLKGSELTIKVIDLRNPEKIFIEENIFDN